NRVCFAIVDAPSVLEQYHAVEVTWDRERIFGERGSANTLQFVGTQFARWIAVSNEIQRMTDTGGFQQVRREAPRIWAPIRWLIGYFNDVSREPSLAENPEDRRSILI